MEVFIALQYDSSLYICYCIPSCDHVAGRSKRGKPVMTTKFWATNFVVPFIFRRRRQITVREMGAYLSLLSRCVGGDRFAAMMGLVS